MASTRSKQDLTDVLGDTLDEFEGGNGDVAGLVRDAGTSIDELAPPQRFDRKAGLCD
jgi:hypothetical protein